MREVLGEPLLVFSRREVLARVSNRLERAALAHELDELLLAHQQVERRLHSTQL